VSSRSRLLLCHGERSASLRVRAHLRGPALGVRANITRRRMPAAWSWPRVEQQPSAWRRCVRPAVRSKSARRSRCAPVEKNGQERDLSPRFMTTLAGLAVIFGKIIKVFQLFISIYRFVALGLDFLLLEVVYLYKCRGDGPTRDRTSFAERRGGGSAG